MAYTNATTQSMGTSPLDEEDGSIFTYISYLVLTLLLTIGLVAHILAILATWKANNVKAESNRHTLPSFLLTCLLRIDMVAVIFFFVRGFVAVIPSVRGHAVYCDFNISTNIFFTWSSGLANCLMCAERSASLIAPFFHRQYATLAKAKVALVILQVSALFICSLPFFGFGTYKKLEEGVYDCVSPGDMQATQRNKYHLYFSILFFLVGFSIITCILVCNVIIVYFIFHLKNKVAHLNISTIPEALSNPQKDGTQSFTSLTTRKSSSETRFAMIMILVSIAYMISWLPLYLERFLAAFSVDQSEDSKRVGIWIHVFNYVITPVIFVFFKRRNRAGLRLVCVDYCCCCCHGYRKRAKERINISEFGSEKCYSKARRANASEVVTENTLNRQHP